MYFSPLQVAENQLLAPFVLNEKLDKVFDISAAVVIIIGASITTAFGPTDTDVCAVRARASACPSCICAVPLRVHVCGCGACQCPRSSGRVHPPHARVNLPEATPARPHIRTSLMTLVLASLQVEQILLLFGKVPFIVFEAITTLLLILCLALMWNPNEKLDKLRFLMFAYTAGFLGGQQNLFLKGVGTLGAWSDSWAAHRNTHRTHTQDAFVVCVICVCVICVCVTCVCVICVHFRVSATGACRWPRTGG